MTSPEDERRIQGLRLQLARAHAGYERPSAAARQLRFNKDTYTQHENGTRSLKNAAASYAEAFGVPVQWLIWGHNPPDWLSDDQRNATTTEKPSLRLVRGSDLQAPSGVREPVSQFGLRPVTRSIPVVGNVQAGIWREATALDIRLAQGFDPQTLDELKGEALDVDVPGYERAVLFALKVHGPSMNLHYQDGSYVIAAPPAEAGLQHEDHVVVQRNRAGLVETTVKEFVLRDDGTVELWPRSTDEEFQTPLLLNPREGDQDRPVIVGIVVVGYNRRQRSGRPAYLPETHAE